MGFAKCVCEAERVGVFEPLAPGPTARPDGPREHVAARPDLVLPADGRRGEHEPVDALRPRRGEELRHESAHRRAEDVRALNLQGVEDADKILGKSRHRVPLVGLVGAAAAAQLRHDEPEVLGEPLAPRRPQPRPDPKAGDEKERHPCPLLLNPQAHAVHNDVLPGRLADERKRFRCRDRRIHAR